MTKVETTKKIAFFENLKKTHGGKILVNDILKACNLVTCTLGKIKKNSDKTKNAGYEIYENNEGDWISVLDNRFEVNLATGQTFSIWTDTSALAYDRNYALDEAEFGMSYAKTFEEKVFWLNVFARRAAEKSNAEIIACLDDYFVNSDDAAEVKEIEAQATKKTETIYLANTGAYTYKLENGEGLDDYYFKQKLHEAIKNGAKIKIRNGLTLYGWIDFSPLEMPSIEICDANRMTELGDWTDKRIAAIIEYPNNTQVNSKEGKEPIAEEVKTEKEIFKEKILANADKLKAKVAEQKSRPHKKVIYWDDLYNETIFLEVKILQKDFKKFLKLGQLNLAENVFNNIKSKFRKTA